jgi:GxxExxY protein
MLQRVRASNHHGKVFRHDGSAMDPHRRPWAIHSKLRAYLSRYARMQPHDASLVSESPLVEPDDRLDGLARTVVDAALEVHKILGPGFAESVYEEALAVELAQRAIPFERQVPLSVRYKGFCVGEGRVDLLVAGDLIVELKSVETLAAVHIAQVLSYLKAFGRPLGLLITFNVKLLRTGIRRVVLSRF